MKNDANVLPFAAQDKRSSAATGKLPVTLTHVRNTAAALIKSNIQELFANADDSLFEMADRAISNSEQNTLFEAMRDLRLKRKNIESSFLQQLLESFASLNQHLIGAAPTLDSYSFESLSLIQNDALEESVAIDSMVAKVKRRDELALQHLTARFNHELSRKITEESNPLGPRVLSEIFIKSCNNINFSINIKLIILKLFEKHVLSELDTLYQKANEILINANILPSLKSTVAASPKRNTPVNITPSDTAASETASPATAASSAELQVAFSELQSMLAQLRGNALPVRQVPDDAVPISSNDLMRLLSHMQQHSPDQSIQDHNLREQLDKLLTRATAKSKDTRVVGQVDDDVINLVAMLFEFILDDRNIPDSLKALIARLQIPLLKVAVLDKTFFNRGSHPARRLLNEIASAALGWSEQDSERRDNLYQKIESIVQRTLTDFTDDPNIFNELLADFVAFSGSERRRSELLEQRTRDAEEGRARAEAARLQVEQELNTRLLGKTLPEVVVQLLQEAWSKVLLLTYLKNGNDSSEWRDNIATMDDLIWSIEPHEDAQARLKLLQLVPILLRQLRNGFSHAAIDPFIANDFFNRLEALHVQAFQRYKRQSATVASSIENLSDEFIAETTHTTEMTLDELPVELHKAARQEQPEAAVMVEVQAEIVLQQPETIDHAPNKIILDDDDPALLQVDSLHTGSWIEFTQDDQRKLRCKLVAIIKSTGRYIFVNRSGVKVLEKNRMGLAAEFKNNSVTLLDNALLFDRALESVIGNLRRLKNT
jgi:hypothetical protein